MRDIKKLRALESMYTQLCYQEQGFPTAFVEPSDDPTKPGIVTQTYYPQISIPSEHLTPILDYLVKGIYEERQKEP